MSVPTEFFLIGVISGLTGAALFGLSNIVYKSQSAEIQPVAINAFKMWIAIIPILIVVLILFIPTGFHVPATSIPFLILSIVFGAGIGDLIYLTSQARLGVSRAFPIAMTFPLITYLFSIIFISEVLLPSRIFGVVLTIVGVSLITREQTRQGKEEQPNTEEDTQRRWDKAGIALALLAAIFWAAAIVILQFGLIGADPLGANLIRILAGSAFLIPVFLYARKRGMPIPTKRVSKRILVAGFFGMGIGSILYVYAVKLTGAAVTSVLAATAPLFALPFSILVLKERVTPLIITGTLFTVIGIWLVILGI